MKDIQKVLEVVKDEINSSINLTQSQITGANIAITKIENLVGVHCQVSIQPPTQKIYEMRDGTEIFVENGKPIWELKPAEYDFDPIKGKLTVTQKYRRLSD